MKKWIRFLAVGVAAASFAVSASAAGTTSYIYDDYGNSVPAPNTYVTKKILTGRDLGTTELNAPQDIYIDKDNNIYIADKGNNRVLVLDQNFKLAQEITQLSNTETPNFVEPMGVFVDNDGLLYICDSGNGRVVKIDRSCKVLTEYTKPDTKVLPDDFVYKPYKVAVDSAGGVYVVAYGLYQGLIYYQNDGTFLNFYGSSKVEVTVAVIAENIWKSFFTKEQRESMSRTIPTEYTNIYIDARNFVYTSIIQTENSLDEARKLNALGNNVLRYNGFNTYYPKNNFGDIEVEWYRGNQINNKFVDIYVDEDGIISLLDQERGRIFVYNKENDLLLTYGNKGTHKGEFLTPTAISQLGEHMLVLDAEKNSLTVLVPTAYTTELKNMMKLYSKGLYDQTIDGFHQLLEDNSNLSLAYKSIGKAYLQQGEYRVALDYFKRANDRQGYSDALKEYRKVFVRENILLLLFGMAAAILLLRFLIKQFKKWLLKGKDA